MCTNIKELDKEVDAIDYDYVQEGNKTIYDKEASAKEAEIYNKYIKDELRYTGSDDVIATFGFQRYLEDSYDWVMEAMKIGVLSRLLSLPKMIPNIVLGNISMIKLASKS